METKQIDKGHPKDGITKKSVQAKNRAKRHAKKKKELLNN